MLSKQYSPKSGGEKALRSLITSLPEWCDTSVRMDAARRAADVPGQEQLVRALEERHGAHLRKSGMLFLCRIWRIRSQLWVLKQHLLDHAAATCTTGAAGQSPLALTLAPGAPESSGQGAPSKRPRQLATIRAPLPKPASRMLSLTAPQASQLLSSGLVRLLAEAATCVEGRAACEAALKHRCRTHFVAEVRGRPVVPFLKRTRPAPSKVAKASASTCQHVLTCFHDAT